MYCLVFLFFSFCTYAVQYTYRADSRPPDVVFSEGFQPLGNNDNLYFHVEGITCYTGSRETAFVSTSASRDFSVGWGQLNRPGTTYYVYRIRATNNFYDAYQSLMSGYNNTHDARLFNTARTNRYQEEYSALGGIIPSQIVEAEEFISNGEDALPSFVMGIPNPDYVHENTDSNGNVYPVRDIDTDSDTCTACVASHLSEKKRSLQEQEKIVHYCKVTTIIPAFM
jgi:pertussis toxin subunit 1